MEPTDRQKAFLLKYLPQDRTWDDVLTGPPEAIGTLADTVWQARARLGMVSLLPDQRQGFGTLLSQNPNLRQTTTKYAGLLERRPDLALRVQINPAELLEVVKKEIECRNLSRACGTLGKRAGLGVIVLNVSLAMFNLKLRTFLARFRLTLSPEMQDLLDNLFSETPALQEEQKIKQTAQVQRGDKAQFVLREQMALLEQNIELLQAIEKILATQQAPTAVAPALPPSGHGPGHKKGVGSGQGPSSGTGTGTKGKKPPKGKPPGPQGGTP